VSSNIIPIGQARVPAAMRARLQGGVALNKNFSDGVRDAFPMLSIKGKVFRIRMDGQETPLIDQQTRQVIPYLDVVLANASRMISKAYFIKGFSDDGEFTPPDCWSLDGIKPDPSVANKQNPTCVNCPKNAFGSAPSRDPSEGKRGGKACADARRIAVMMPGQLGDPNKEPMTFLLRIPATSLKSLKAYAQMLERQGWEPAACVTRLSFDYNEAYPKLVFNFVDGLNDAEFDQVLKIAESPSVAAMLEAPDFDTGVPANPTPNAATEQRVRQAAPIMETDPVPQRASPEALNPLSQPVQAQKMPPVQTQAADTIIDLPSGERFNTATGEFIAPAQPKVEMPSLDANVLALPDGRFYNQTTKQFVVGPEVGAPPASKAPAEAPKRQRASRAKPKEETTPAPEVKAAAQQETAIPEQEQQEQEASPAPQVNGNGHNAGIQPASAALDSILKTVLPKR
jgi:hypothetical protein